MACDYMQANSHQNINLMTLELLDRQLRELDTFCTDGQRMSTPYANLWLEVSLVQTPHEIPQETAFFGTQQFVRIQELCANAVINVCTSNPSL